MYLVWLLFKVFFNSFSKIDHKNILINKNNIIYLNNFYYKLHEYMFYSRGETQKKLSTKYSNNKVKLTDLYFKIHSTHNFLSFKRFSSGVTS